MVVDEVLGDMIKALKVISHQEACPCHERIKHYTRINLQNRPSIFAPTSSLTPA